MLKTTSNSFFIVYIGLYAEGDNLCEETRVKIHEMRNLIKQRKMAKENYKKKEILMADQDENQEILDKMITQEEKPKKIYDPFFVDSDEEVQPQAKLVVDTRGNIIDTNEGQGNILFCT